MPALATLAAQASVTHDLFHLETPLVEKLVRTVLVYAALILLLRFVGKRTLAQLNPFDLIVLLLLANVVQNAVIGPDDSVTGGVIGALTLVAVNEVVVRLSNRSPRFRGLLAGRRARIIRGGHLDRAELARSGIREEELDQFAHVDDLGSVQSLTLLPGGKIEVHLEDFARPPTEADIRDIVERLSGQLTRLQASVDALAR
ncbi:MAG: DUF421 domain-containing protein [Actinomycetota bacterium]